MAKVTGPLMSLDASGTVGKTAVFSKWKGQNYVRLRVTPMNPKTSGQAQIRTYLGAVGQALSVVLTIAKDTVEKVGSAFFQAGVAGAPAGQSWISWAVRTIIGTSAGSIEATQTAYGSVNGTNQGYYAAAAATLGLSSFATSYGTPTPVTAAEQLYALAQFAEESLQYDGFASGRAAATAQQLVSFDTYLTTTTA